MRVRVPCMRSVRVAVMGVSMSRLVPTCVLVVLAVILAVQFHLRYCTCPMAALPLVVLLVRQFDTLIPRIN